MKKSDKILLKLTKNKGKYQKMIKEWREIKESEKKMTKNKEKWEKNDQK